MSETKATVLPYTEEHVKALAAKWADIMQIDAPFEIQLGTFDGLPEEARASGDEFGATFGYPDDKFIVCISDKCPEDRLENVIVHELVHVHTFSQSGPDERAAMEVATELAAQLVVSTEENRNAAYYRGRDAARLSARRKYDERFDRLLEELRSWRNRAKAAEGQLRAKPTLQSEDDEPDCMCGKVESRHGGEDHEFVPYGKPTQQASGDTQGEFRGIPQAVFGRELLSDHDVGSPRLLRASRPQGHALD